MTARDRRAAAFWASFEARRPTIQLPPIDLSRRHPAAYRPNRAAVAALLVTA